VLSAASLWASVNAYGMALIIENEQASAVKVERMRQDRDDSQDAKNAAQQKINVKVKDILDEHENRIGALEDESTSPRNVR